jgi:MtN3 and saliva related transmembrane protein
MPEPAWLSALGLIAGGLTTIAWIPQVVRTIRTRSARDLSWWYLVTFATGTSLWIYYGLRISSVPVTATNVLITGLVCVLALGKASADRRQPQRRGAARSI